MQRKQSGHNYTAPNRSGHPVQQKKKKHCIRHMKQNTNEMMHRRLLAKQLAVQHVRHPGYRMPIARMTGCERPLKIFPLYTALYVRIRRDIIRIIVINKIVPQRRQVRSESHGRE